MAVDYQVDIPMSRVLSTENKALRSKEPAKCQWATVLRLYRVQRCEPHNQVRSVLNWINVMNITQYIELIIVMCHFRLSFSFLSWWVKMSWWVDGLTLIVTYQIFLKMLSSFTCSSFNYIKNVINRHEECETMPLNTRGFMESRFCFKELNGKGRLVKNFLDNFCLYRLTNKIIAINMKCSDVLQFAVMRTRTLN